MSDNDIIISQHELIDPKYQFFDQKIIVTEDSANIEVLQHIFTDFINGKNLSYYKMFLEQMVNSLISIYSSSKLSNPTSDDLVLTELDNLNNLEGKTEKTTKIIYFQTSLLNEKDFNNLEYNIFNVFRYLIKNNSKYEIQILSIYLSPKFAEHLLHTFSSNKNPTNIHFITLFFNDNLVRYHNYIEKGGVMIGDDEGDFHSQSVVLKRDNFVEYFRNLWKRNF